MGEKGMNRPNITPKFTPSSSNCCNHSIDSTLTTIYRQFGEEGMRDGKKLIGWFMDFAPDLKRELILLRAFIQCNGHKQILDAKKRKNSDGIDTVNRIVNQMREEMLAEEPIRAFCESFCRVVGYSFTSSKKTQPQSLSESNAEIMVHSNEHTVTSTTHGSPKPSSSKQPNSGTKHSSSKRRDVALHVLYVICIFCFWGWYAFAMYSMIKAKDVLNYKVELFVAGFLVIIAVWNMLEKVSNEISKVPILIPSIFYGSYIFGVGPIMYLRWEYGSEPLARAWRFIGINVLILILVFIVFNLAGRAIYKKMK